jgi:hypothetical protein
MEFTHASRPLSHRPSRTALRPLVIAAALLGGVIELVALQRRRWLRR